MLNLRYYICSLCYFDYFKSQRISDLIKTSMYLCVTCCLFLVKNAFDACLSLLQVLKDGAEGEDLYEVAKLFQLH